MNKILYVSLALIILMNIFIPSYAAQKEVEGTEVSVDEMRKFVYYQKEKDPFVAIGYSLVLPGLGNAYAHDWGNALISWVIILGSFAIGSNQPEGEGAVIMVEGILLGYLYSVCSSWVDARQYNKELLDSLKGRTRNFSPYLNISSAEPGLAVHFGLMKEF